MVIGLFNSRNKACCFCSSRFLDYILVKDAQCKLGIAGTFATAVGKRVVRATQGKQDSTSTIDNGDRLVLGHVVYEAALLSC